MSKTTNQSSWDHLLTEISNPSKDSKLPPVNRSSFEKNHDNPGQNSSNSQSGQAPYGQSFDRDKNVSSELKNQTLSKDPIEPESRDREIYSVSQINRVIKKQLEGEHPRLWVRGEISNFKAHSSGHYYFSLKDSQSQISGVMFKAYNSRLRFQPENGMEVTVFGKISVYEPRGQYQIFVRAWNRWEPEPWLRPLNS